MTSLAVAITMGAVLHEAPEHLADWSIALAAVVWLAGPLALGYLLGRLQRQHRLTLAASSAVFPFYLTAVETWTLKSNLWPIAFVAVCFWAGLVYLGATAAGAKEDAEMADRR